MMHNRVQNFSTVLNLFKYIYLKLTTRYTGIKAVKDAKFSREDAGT